MDILQSVAFYGLRPVVTSLVLGLVGMVEQKQLSVGQLAAAEILHQRPPQAIHRQPISAWVEPLLLARAVLSRPR